MRPGQEYVLRRAVRAVVVHIGPHQRLYEVLDCGHAKRARRSSYSNLGPAKVMWPKTKVRRCYQCAESPQ